MSNWSSYQFTRKGEQLRAKVEAGKCKLTLTKIKIGNGNVTLGDIKDMNDLKSPQLVLGISSCAVSAEDDRVCEVVGIASSSNVESAFSVTEMGLFATDPDVGEILYLVEIDTSPDDMPNKNAQSPVTLTYQVELVTSNTANVTALVSPAGLVTVKMMSAHCTAAELDHPEKSVHKKHLHQDAYESPALTGTPTAPTAGHGTNNGQIANTAFVAQAIAALVNSAPEALDTLQELAAALGNDANFAATVTNALAGKVSKSGDTMTGALKFDENENTQMSIFPAHYYHRLFGGSTTYVHAYDTLPPPRKKTMYEIRVADGGGGFVAHTFTAEGLVSNLKGKADHAGNADHLGGQPLQWIIDQINAAKTGIVASNIAPNGWVKFANGLIVQWGMGSEQLSEAIQTVIFPITFSRGCFSLITGTMIFSTGIRNDSMWQVATVERERAVLFHQHFTTDGIGKTKPTYIAIGV